MLEREAKSYHVNYTIISKSGHIYKMNMELYSEEINRIHGEIDDAIKLKTPTLDMGRFVIASSEIDASLYFDWYDEKEGPKVIFPEVI